MGAFFYDLEIKFQMTAPLALRVLKGVVDCPAGNAYKISVTGLAFVSPKPHD